MPFTPLHLGPALILGYALRKKIHWPTFIIANIIVDIEGFLLITGLLRIKGYPLHGYLHTFLASVIAGSILGYIMFHADKFLENLFKQLYLVDSRRELWRYILAGISGWTLHVLLDAPLYYDIKPLYPLKINPFLISENYIGLYSDLMIIMLIFGIILYAIHVYKSSSQKLHR